MGIRRSFAWASADRYFAVVLNFATLMVTARLLTPAEFGIAVLGLSVLGLADSLQDFGGTNYIVQVKNLTPERLQAAFTITFVLTVPLAVILFASAGSIASFYDTPRLKDFLQLTSLCFLLGPFVGPAYAVMRRNFEFSKLAVLNGVSAIVNATLTITLAFLGFSYMSFAWATLAAGIVYCALCWWWGPQCRIYRLTLTDWRDICAYGVYDSLKKLLQYAADAVPLLAFGKTLGTDGVGLYQRAMSISRVPEKTMLAGLGPVLLPTLSQHAREGREMKAGFLNSVEHVTAFFWPALLGIVILANPIVEILLGHQWGQAVPLVQIIAAAFLLQLPASIVNSVQIAAGAIRDTFVLALVTIPPAVALQVFASTYGLEMAAASLLITSPLCGIVSIVMMRWRVPFTWSELWAPVWRSGIVAIFSAIGPAAVAIYAGGTHQVTIAGGVLGFITSPIGWLVGMRLVNHPIFDEVTRAVAYVRGALFGNASDAPDR